MKAVFNKGQQKRKERYAAINKTYSDLINAGSDKTAAVEETKVIHAPISIATIYRALKSSAIILALLIPSTPIQSEVKHEVSPEYQQEVSIGKFGMDNGINGGYYE